ALQLPAFKAIIDRFHINVELHFQLYLLANISYYLTVYQAQPRLHVQALWLIRTWSKTLAAVLPVRAVDNHRKAFIRDLQQRLASERHAFLKTRVTDLEKLPESADLDILVPPATVQRLVDFAKHYPTVHKVNCCRKSFMTTLELYFSDRTYLSLDLLSRFQRKAYNILPAEQVLDSAHRNRAGFSVPAAHFDLEYAFLFYVLNGRSLPPRYVEHFERYPAEKQTIFMAYLNAQYGLQLSAISDLSAIPEADRLQVRAVVKNLPQNKGRERLRQQWAYVQDTVRDMVLRKGFVITFSGVDGAGKSTIIEALRQQLVQRYRKKVVVLRHRPSVLPILSSWTKGKARAEADAAATLPRQGRNRNSLASLLRFTYYFTDYLFGQLYVYTRYLLRGYVVLYDRYYFDFINDGPRSNIRLPKWLTRLGYGLVLKPRLNFFLHAPSEVILQRKQELDKEAIGDLTSAYLQLFSQYDQRYRHSQYIGIQNIDQDATMETILEAYTKAA
ncbi:MAG: hypothetical protein AAGB22_02505, partial [Bacteroidota bacterium]